MSQDDERVAGDPSRFGVFVPSFVWPGDGPERARGIKTFAQEVERLGFDSIFITDHVITARHFYNVGWLDSLTTLAFVASITERVRLGTSILIAPLRHPVVLAKQIATLEHLSNERYIIGVGVGWYEPEFAAVGVTKRERGERTDEILEIVRLLLTGEDRTFTGKHYAIDGVSIDPRPPRMPPVWIGGGSQLANERSPEAPRFARSVMARVARADGWIARPTSPPDQIADDWRGLSSYLARHGRRPEEIVVAHENFLHLVDSDDRQKVVREQHAAFARVMSEARGSDYLESVYLFGTPDDIVEKLQARVDAGVQYFILHTMTPDPGQLAEWVRLVIPRLRFPRHSGAASLAPAGGG